ncbi:MAG: ATP-binding protein [Myxococcota bacterium]
MSQSVASVGTTAQRSARVLLVEDDPELVEAARGALTRAGMRVEVARNLAQALKLAQSGHHECWLVGEAMQRTDPSVVTSLQRLDLSTPLLVLCRGAEPPVGLEPGVLPLPVKPEGEQWLAESVRQALAHHRQTESLRAAQQMAQHTVRELEERLQDHADHAAKLQRQLEEARVSLAQADALRSQFLANVSHELRTPLTTIVGFTSVLLDQASGPLTPEQGKQLELIQGAGTQLLELINDLLDLARLEAGRVEPVSVPLELAPLLEDLRSSSVEMLAGRPVEVHVRVRPAQVVSDPSKVRQILWNLCMNAARSTQKGRLDLEVEPTAEGVALHVADTGEGMSQEELEHIFEKMHQLGPSRRKMVGPARGSRLGLALAADLARLLGGRLEVQSQQGKGSRFTLHLPSALPPREARRRA